MTYCNLYFVGRLWEVMAGSDKGLDYRQPIGMRAPESYTNKVMLLKLTSITKERHSKLSVNVFSSQLQLGTRFGSNWKLYVDF